MKSSRPRKRTGSPCDQRPDLGELRRVVVRPDRALAEDEERGARRAEHEDDPQGKGRAARAERAAERDRDHHRRDDRQRLGRDVGAAEQGRQDPDRQPSRPAMPAGSSRARAARGASPSDQRRERRSAPRDRRRAPAIRRMRRSRRTRRPARCRAPERRQRLLEVAEVGAEPIRVQRREAAEVGDPAPFAGGRDRDHDEQAERVGGELPQPVLRQLGPGLDEQEPGQHDGPADGADPEQSRQAVVEDAGGRQDRRRQDALERMYRRPGRGFVVDLRERGSEIRAGRPARARTRSAASPAAAP